MNYKEALDRAARLCSTHEHSAADISEKLRQWGLPESEAGKAVDWLIREKFIDEERFASYFVRDKFRINHWGKVKIRYALRQKGIPEKLADEALLTLDDQEYRGACHTILRQKVRTLKEENFLKKKAKLIQFGMQRGFESALLYELADEVLKK